MQKILYIALITSLMLFQGQIFVGSPTIVQSISFGAKCDGVTDDTAHIQAAIDAAFGPASAPHGNTGNQVLNKPLQIQQGHCIVTGSGLQLTKVMGGLISGAGRFATNIENTSGGNVFTTNGFEYFKIENMKLTTSGSGIAFDWDWDGTSNAGCQSVTFSDMFFDHGSVGVRIGNSGFQCSEGYFSNNFYNATSRAGIETVNFNALQHTVVGGNFQSNNIGILVSMGSIPVIHGVGFQTSAVWDIEVDASANDTYDIAGVRTESANFANFVRGSAKISAVTQANGNSGVFVQAANHQVTLENCISYNGQISFAKGGSITSSEFGRTNPILNGAGSVLFLARVHYGATYDGSGAGMPADYQLGYMNGDMAFHTLGP